jgi:lipoprotein-anchoring transpeptidase ErfK/SrfK
MGTLVGKDTQTGSPARDGEMWLEPQGRDERPGSRINRPATRKFHLGFVKFSALDRPSFSSIRVGTPKPRSRLSLQKHPRDAHRTGQVMVQAIKSNRAQPSRVSSALVFTAVLAFAPVLLSSAASAQVLGYASTQQSSFPADNMMTAPVAPAVSDEGADDSAVLPERLRRSVVAFETREAPGTVIVDTGNTALYFVLGQGRAVRYGVGVGREGFTWSGVQTISRKAEWPDWHPPAQMIARQPYLPRFMAGGPGNPLGARAMYLGSSDYRIHGTNDPTTIGKFVSSGCIRLTNEDVADLFSRVDVGTKVVVLPKNAPHIEARATAARPVTAQPRPVVTSVAPGRQALNLSTSSVY